MKTTLTRISCCFVLHKRYEDHFCRFFLLICPSSGSWRPLWSDFHVVLSFIGFMKTICTRFSCCFVLHKRYEDHFDQIFMWFCPSSGSWRPFAPEFRAVLSFISVMKTISADFSLCFVLHPPYEDHFDQNFVLFCPSSTLWRPFQPIFHAVLSFIRLMKTTLTRFSCGFVLHKRYEHHLHQIFVLFCPS